ncbi:MAG: helix-turn-helix domain-containing protein [Hyphomicrobiales bacterium]|nr:helix-turn-helix domain-containing protein [Hyphomicrobiales bacterium]
MYGDLRAASGLLTTVEAADYLRLSPRTLEDMRVTGAGPRYFKLGPGKRSKVVYRREDLETWLARFGFGSTSEYRVRPMGR